MKLFSYIDIRIYIYLKNENLKIKSSSKKIQFFSGDVKVCVIRIVFNRFPYRSNTTTCHILPGETVPKSQFSRDMGLTEKSEMEREKEKGEKRTDG